MKDNPPKIVNPLLDLAERIFVVFSLLVFSGVLTCASLNNGGEGAQPAGVYYTSPMDRLVSLWQLGIYILTFFFLFARFKTVIRPALRDPFLWALAVLVVSSFLWSDLPEISRKYGFMAFETTVFGLYMASRFSLKEQVQLVACALGIAAVFSLLYTLGRPGSGIENGTHTGAWRGPIIHKNLFARLMIPSALASLLTALDTRGFYRYIIWAITGLTVALIVLSNSRTALVVFLTLALLLPFYRALRWSDNIAIPFFITLILVGGSLATWMAGNWDSLLIRLGKDPTLSGRTEIWEAVIEKMADRPWLGYGYSAFWQDGGEADFVWRILRYKVYQAHNGFLNVGIELGLLGLAFFGLSIIFAYIRSLQWVRLSKTYQDLWPIIYVTFLLMYNYTETTVIEHHSIYWVLYVGVTLSVKFLHTAPIEESHENLRIRQHEDLVEKT
jgi:exopolysaccharide production protein ExoQ